MALTVSYPTVYIRPEAKAKLDMYLDIAPEEISGFGLVEEIPEGLLITDVFTFHQESSMASTDISGEDLAKGILELFTNGVDPEKMRLWWHSHVNMSASFSSTDDNTMDTTWPDAPFFVSVVGNKKGEYCVRVDVFKPVRMYVDGGDLALYTEAMEKGLSKCKAAGCETIYEPLEKGDQGLCEEHEALYSELLTEVDEKVKKPVHVTSKWGDDKSKGSWYYSNGAMGDFSKIDSPSSVYTDGSGFSEFEWMMNDCRYPGCNTRFYDPEFERDYCSEHSKYSSEEKKPNTSPATECLVMSCKEPPTGKRNFCVWHDYLADKVLNTFPETDFENEDLADIVEYYEDEFDSNAQYTEIAEGDFDSATPMTVIIRDDDIEEIEPEPSKEKVKTSRKGAKK